MIIAPVNCIVATFKYWIFGIATLKFAWNRRLVNRYDCNLSQCSAIQCPHYLHWVYSWCVCNSKVCVNAFDSPENHFFSGWFAPNTVITDLKHSRFGISSTQFSVWDFLLPIYNSFYFLFANHHPNSRITSIIMIDLIVCKAMLKHYWWLRMKMKSIRKSNHPSIDRKFNKTYLNNVMPNLMCQIYGDANNIDVFICSELKK